MLTRSTTSARLLDRRSERWKVPRSALWPSRRRNIDASQSTLTSKAMPAYRRSHQRAQERRPPALSFPKPGERVVRRASSRRVVVMAAAYVITGWWPLLAVSRTVRRQGPVGRVRPLGLAGHQVVTPRLGWPAARAGPAQAVRASASWPWSARRPWCSPSSRTAHAARPRQRPHRRGDARFGRRHLHSLIISAA